MKHVVIIGNGISGTTAARHIRKQSNHRITIISNETKYFYSRTALMYIYMGHMKFEHTKPYEDWFWEKNRIELVSNYVKSVDTNYKTLYLQDGSSMQYDVLVIASGSKPNMFGWPGQDLQGVSGMYSLQDLQAIEKYTNEINRGVIVGGGLIGIELAEMLHSRNIKVTFLVRESSFWNTVLPVDESELVNRQIMDNHIDLRLNTELSEIIPDEHKRVKAVKTTGGELIECQFVGLTAGVSPNIEFLNKTEIKTDRGVLVNEFLETNIEDVYAIGDCAQHIHPPGSRKAVEQVWYTGRMQGETVAFTICGRKLKYQPGVWFNSAKFFDLEYQTYGWVWNELKTAEDSLYWENKDRNKCLRLVYEKSTGHLLGINVLGIRMKHEIAEKWIKEKYTIDNVVENLKIANFDPEFSVNHEHEIRDQFSKILKENRILST